MADETTNQQSGKTAGICDNCRRNPAEHLVTDVDKEGRKVDLKLCAECATKRGLFAAPVQEKESPNTVLDELKNRIQESDVLAVCPRCKLSYADFKKTLRLGCEECYVAFRERLTPILKRVHNASRHIGRAPQPGRNTTRDFEVQRLRRELSKAIEAEDYERAAAVRDRIRRVDEEPSPGDRIGE